jgi:FMN phosphatase YigB (HAD superfamily)
MTRINLAAVHVIAFDLFGTVFSFADVDVDQRKSYVDHISKPDWSPLFLPVPWLDLPLHPDSLEGIRRLADRFDICSCSNAPYEFTQELLHRSGLAPFMAVADVESSQAFKPNPLCYESIRFLMDC